MSEKLLASRLKKIAKSLESVSEDRILAVQEFSSELRRKLGAVKESTPIVVVLDELIQQFTGLKLSFLEFKLDMMVNLQLEREALVKLIEVLDKVK